MRVKSAAGWCNSSRDTSRPATTWRSPLPAKPAIPLADAWFALAERGKQVMGKRQDAEKQRDGDRQRARVREVAALQPEVRIEIPLQPGWSFAQGMRDDLHSVVYRLQRVD